VDCIFERISSSFLFSVEKKRSLLLRVGDSISGMRFHNATVQINPVLAMLQDRGNVYLLRRKVDGIHLEEALDQLRTSSHLKDMNREAGIDQMVILTINEIKQWLLKEFHSRLREEIEDFTFFIPWDLERNMPNVTVDITGAFMHTVWIA
jgi:hypothetical protein